MNTVAMKLDTVFLDNSFIDVCNDDFNIKQYLRFKVNSNGREYQDDPFYVCNIDDVVKKHLKFQDLLPQVKPFFGM